MGGQEGRPIVRDAEDASLLLLVFFSGYRAIRIDLLARDIVDCTRKRIDTCIYIYMYVYLIFNSQ